MEDENDRAAILKRRARLIAAALAGLVGSAGATQGCEGEVVIQDGGGGHGAGGGTGGTGAEPQPCLGVALGGEGPGGEGPGGEGQGGEPQPCLRAPIGGEGGAGGKPQPCLAPK